ncbi:hypothetical protein [Pseudomonas sp. Marseille-Q7302]
MQAIDIQTQAQQLRDQGLSVRKIADLLGKSKSWVDRNTKASLSHTVPVKAASAPTSQRDIAVAQVLAKATSPEGCNTSEFNDTIKSVYGTVRDEDVGRYVVDCDAEARKSIKRSVKTAADRQGLNALFFEGFIDRSTPLASNQLMLTLAQDLHERVELLVAEYRDEYPQVSVYAIQQALIGLAVPGFRPESVEAFAERNATSAQALQQNVAPIAFEEIIETPLDSLLADLADIDAELSGIAPAELPAITHAEYVEDIAEVVADEEGEDFGPSLDDLEDDESMINYDAVDFDHVDQDDRFIPDAAVQQGIRDLLKGRQAERKARLNVNTKPKHIAAVEQEAEDDFYRHLADAEATNHDFIF